MFKILTSNTSSSALPFHGLDDDEFSLMLYELLSGPISFDVDRLLSLMALSNDLDPDCDLYSDLNTCDYYTEYNLNNKLSKPRLQIQIVLSFFHLNIHSLPRHFDNLINYLSSINNKISIIGISETWLK